MDFNKIIQFRQAGYELFNQGKDALFELTDAAIQLPHIQSFAELSLAPAFHRKWHSVYEALEDGRPNGTGLMKLYLQQLPEGERLLMAGDHSAVERLWSKTLEGRRYQHQSTPIPGRRPVTIGYGYSTIAVIPQEENRWALPLLHERIMDAKPVAKGAEQLARVCAELRVRPITLWDCEYGCAAFLEATQWIKADKIIRLRVNLALEGSARPRTNPKGAVPKHGQKLKFSDPSTWWSPDEQEAYHSDKFGATTVKVWHHLRFSKALDCEMTVALVERSEAPNTRRKPRLLWFAWVGDTPEFHWWEIYCQRYPIEHWYRFAKGCLHWLAPKVGSPVRADRWAVMMPFITWELWLARSVVQDHPLPWQKPMPRPSLGRVRQSFRLFLAEIGTPARACKPRGKSPDWPVGKPRQNHEEHPVNRSEQWAKIRKRNRQKKAQEKLQNTHSAPATTSQPA